MKKLFVYITSITAIWLLSLGFTSSSDIRVPYKKVDKSIKKYLHLDEFRLFQMDNVIGFNSQSKVFKVISSDSSVGYVYVGRINSCREGGCSVGAPNTDSGFEYFDYYLVANSFGEVENVKVYNYQATHGHQVMSKGWLKQFIGFNGQNQLMYGSDIQAISGATISAKAITNSVQEVQKLIQNIIN